MGILEQILAAQEKTNTLLEALAAGGVVAGGTKGEDTKSDAKGGKKSAPKKEDTASKPKHTKDEVVAAVIAVKSAFGAPAAKEITAKYGLKKIAEAKEDQFDAIFDDCEAKLQEAENGGDEDEV